MDSSFNSEEEGEIVDSFENETAESKAETTKHKDIPEEEENKPVSNLDLINAISKTITTILEDNKNLEDYKKIIKKQSSMVFSANSIPNISIKDYLIRIQTYSNLEKSTLIISLIFIDRICELTGLILTYYNIHRILFSAVLMAIKYNEDNFYDNKYYSEVAGVKLKELKLIEYTFVEMTNFNLFVSPDKYEKYADYLENFEKINDKK